MQVLREGKGQDTRPDKGQHVTIQVAGRTEDGTGVDWNSSLEFILGEGEVIQGIMYTNDASFILLTLAILLEMLITVFQWCGNPDKSKILL